MKNIYLLLFALLCVNSMQAQKRFGIVEDDVNCCSKNGQSKAMRSCKTATGGIQIQFDWKQNCLSTPAGSQAIFAQRQTLGFYSGVNGGIVEKSWDAKEAIQAVRSSPTTFQVHIPDPVAYYGLASGTPIRDLQFVFNDGPSNTQDAWHAEGRTQDAAGNCKDFAIVLATMPFCAVEAARSQDESNFVLAPNPAQAATTMFLNNPTNAVFELILTDVAGHVLRNQTVSGAEVPLNDLKKGLYFVVLRDSEGVAFTKKLAIE